MRSRELGTRNLVAGLRAADPRPARARLRLRGRLVRAPRRRAGDRGRRRAGDDFLAQVCAAWEREAAAAEALGVRVVRMRTGVVLDKGGGALAKMLPFFKLGVGGPVAGGRQYLPLDPPRRPGRALPGRARRRRLDGRGQRDRARPGHQQGVLHARSAARCTARRSPRSPASPSASLRRDGRHRRVRPARGARSARSRSASGSRIRTSEARRAALRARTRTKPQSPLRQLTLHTCM